MNETFRRNYLLRDDLKQNLDTIILAPDNDTAGKKAVDSFKELIKPFHYIKTVEEDLPMELGDDWNKQLCSHKDFNQAKLQFGIEEKYEINLRIIYLLFSSEMLKN